MRTHVVLLNTLSILCLILTISGSFISFMFVKNILGDLQEDIAEMNQVFQNKSDVIWRSLRDINVNPRVLRNRRQVLQRMIGYPLSTSTVVGFTRPSYYFTPESNASEKPEIRRSPTKPSLTTHSPIEKVDYTSSSEGIYASATSKVIGYSIPEPSSPKIALGYGREAEVAFSSTELPLYENIATTTPLESLLLNSETIEEIELNQEKRCACECPKENKCAAGPPGPKGEPGLNGEPGMDGEPGAKGNDMDDVMTMTPMLSHCVVCPQGLPGTAGSDGKKGPRGLRGARGADGINGRNGSPGLSGLHGPEGLPGEDGEKGSDGVKGMDGIAGIGLPGPKGSPGSEGEIGIPGEKGLDGDEGLVGVPGPKGESGIPGKNGQLGREGEVGLEGESGDDAEYCPCPRRHDYHFLRGLRT